MRILDIGAGIEYTDSKGHYKNPVWLMKAGDFNGTLQYAKYRWTCRNTADEIRKLCGSDEWLKIDGIDLEAPGNFTDKGKKLRLCGYDIDNVPDGQYPMITWFYPNPWDIMDFSGRQRISYEEEPNPLDTVMSIIPQKLAPGGRLILETEMMPSLRHYGGGHHRPLDTCCALTIITKTLETLLTESDEKFATDDHYRRFNRVYRKRGQINPGAHPAIYG